MLGVGQINLFDHNKLKHASGTSEHVFIILTQPSRLDRIPKQYSKLLLCDEMRASEASEEKIKCFVKMK